MANWLNPVIVAPVTAVAIAAPASSDNTMNTLARRSLLPNMARLFAAQVRVYCLSALIVGVLGIVALTAMSLSVVRAAGEGTPNLAELWESMTFSRHLAFIFSLIYSVWLPILLAARGVCRITANQMAGEQVSLSKVFADMARFIPAALIYSLIIGVTSMIGFSILIIPGIFVASLFVLVVPTGIYERSGIFATLRRGVSLSYRVWNKALLLTFVSGLVVVLLVLLRNELLDRILPGQSPSLFVVRFALVYIPALLVLILANISFTLLYHEAPTAIAPLDPEPTPGVQDRVPPPIEGSTSQNLNSASTPDSLK
jgi:hypothetical protein